MESYQQAYPLLTKLHILSEVETGYQILHFNSRHNSYSEHNKSAIKNNDNVGIQTKNYSKLLNNNFQWSKRLEIISPSLSERSSILAVRRTIYGILGCKTEISDNWLQWCQSMSRIRRFDLANIALNNAKHYGLNKDIAILTECQILKESGLINKALLLIEPIEVDTTTLYRSIRDYDRNMKIKATVNQTVSSNHNTSSNKRKSNLYEIPEYFHNHENRERYAEKLLLATQCIVASNQRHGKSVESRFQCSSYLCNTEKVHFEYAKYLEFMYHTCRSLEDQQEAIANKNKMINQSSSTNLVASIETGVGVGVGKKRKGLADVTKYGKVGGSGVGPGTKGPGAGKDPPSLNETGVPSRESYRYVKMAIQEYARGIHCNQDPKLLLQALPRLLTLWLSFTALVEGDKSSSTISSSNSIKSKTSQSSSSSFKSILNSRSQDNSNENTEDILTPLEIAQKNVNVAINMIVSQQGFSPVVWYTCMPQLVSRTGKIFWCT